MTWITNLPGAETGRQAAHCHDVAELLAALQRPEQRERAGHIEGASCRLIAYTDALGAYRGVYQDYKGTAEISTPHRNEFERWLLDTFTGMEK